MYSQHQNYMMTGQSFKCYMNENCFFFQFCNKLSERISTKLRVYCREALLFIIIINFIFDQHRINIGIIWTYPRYHNNVLLMYFADRNYKMSSVVSSIHNNISLSHISFYAFIFPITFTYMYPYNYITSCTTRSRHVVGYTRAGT